MTADFTFLQQPLSFILPNITMEQHCLKNAKNGLNTNIYSYLETSDGQSYNLYLNVVHLYDASVNWTYVAA
jgi:hypothetical protein